MPNQVLPVSSNRKDKRGDSSFISQAPDTPVNVLSISIRSGKQHKVLGMVESISFSTSREYEEYYEIQSYPPNDFGSLESLFRDHSFNESLDYEGEVSSIFPGVAKSVTVKLKRPMIYSSNLLEALFKSTGSGEFTTREMDDYRYVPLGEPEGGILDTLGQAATGAALGGVLGAGGSGTAAGAAEGAFAGSLSALIPSDQYSPERTRYVSLLQQVRPMQLTLMIYSPTQRNQVVMGIQFINGWSTNWSLDNISKDSSVVMENTDVVFERLRMYKEL